MLTKPNLSYSHKLKRRIENGNVVIIEDIGMELRDNKDWYAEHVHVQEKTRSFGRRSTQTMLDEAKLSNWNVRLSPLTDHISESWNDVSQASLVIRDNSGLAVSSRNIKLGSDGEKKAQVIHRALTKQTFEQMQKEISSEPGFKLDYLEVIDENNFEKAKTDTQNKRVIIAGWVNQIRLIDNMPMGNK